MKEKDKEQEEIEIELQRCMFCGKRLDYDMFRSPLKMYCNDKCEIELKKLWDNRTKKGVCVSCGNPKIPECQKNQPKKTCLNCMLRINKLLERCKNLNREINGT